MTKHFNGPWRAMPDGTVVSQDGLICDCRANDCFSNEEAQDHARLIAAAPSLLTALQASTCPDWVHNAAHTTDIEALRKIALWYADWNNAIRLTAMHEAEG